MAWEKELTRLRESRELLKAQSEIHRQLMSLEASKVAESLSWTGRVSRAASHLGGVGWAAVGAAGIAGAWFASRRFADLGVVLQGVRTFRSVRPLFARCAAWFRREPAPSAGNGGSPEI